MVQLSVIEAQLTKLGVRPSFFSRPEIRELQHILMNDEEIIKFVSGRYSGGFASLVATRHRLLLIDKRPFYLTVEDIRYDMIAEIDINARLIDSTIRIFTVNKQLNFTSTRQSQLRELARHVQQRVMDFRHYQQVASSPEPGPSLRPAYPITTATALVNMPHILGHSVGAAAVKGSAWVHRHHNPNPFTKSSLMVRSGYIQPPQQYETPT